MGVGTHVVESRSTASATAPSASESTLLAVDRTRLAHERTLMAWIRTATSMISFGFTIAKLVPQREVEGHVRLLSTRTFSTIMIGMALIALLFAAIQHHHEIRALRVKYPDNVPTSNSMIVAGLVSIFGLLAFVAVILGT